MAQETTQKSWFSRHKVLTGIGGVVLFFIIVGSFGGNDKTKGGDGSKASSSASQATSKSYGLNEEVVVRDVKWQVTKAYTADKLKGILGQETASGKWIVVNVTVENLSKEMKTVSGLKLVDDQGREFTSTTKSVDGLGAKKFFVIENINPNVPLTFADAYDVPKDAKGLKLIVGDLDLFGGQSTMIELGI